MRREDLVETEEPEEQKCKQGNAKHPDVPTGARTIVIHCAPWEMARRSPVFQKSWREDDVIPECLDETGAFSVATNLVLIHHCALPEI
jgi:hypothetical protein